MEEKVTDWEERKPAASIDAFCVKIGTSRQIHALSNHDTGENQNDALCSFSVAENYACRYFVADSMSFNNERFLTAEERDGSIREFLEKLEPGKMLYACRPTPLRVTVRFLYGKDFDFIDGDTCSLPLEDFFVSVKGKDNMSSKNIICCIDTGEGLYRVVQLHTGVAAAIGIHAKIARHLMMVMHLTTTPFLNWNSSLLTT